MTTREQLVSLATSWRDQAKHIEDKFGALNPAQTQVATAVYEACAEELEKLVNGKGQ